MTSKFLLMNCIFINCQLSLILLDIFILFFNQFMQPRHLVTNLHNSLLITTYFLSFLLRLVLKLLVYLTESFLGISLIGQIELQLLHFLMDLFQWNCLLFKNIDLRHIMLVLLYYFFEFYLENVNLINFTSQHCIQPLDLSTYHPWVLFYPVFLYLYWVYSGIFGCAQGDQLISLKNESIHLLT